MIDEANLAFERERWDADLDLRERELALRERESRTNRWATPLVIAMWVGVAAIFGNAVVALINGYEERQIESDRSTASVGLEERTAEAARILEVVKTNDPDKAAQNLEFLIKVGLITDPMRLKAMTTYLAERKAGQGPILSKPAASPNIDWGREASFFREIIEKCQGDKKCIAEFAPKYAPDWSNP